MFIPACEYCILYFLGKSHVFSIATEFFILALRILIVIFFMTVLTVVLWLSNIGHMFVSYMESLKVGED